MSKIEIHRIGLADIDKLQDLSRQTFTETFSDCNTAENMEIYLAESFSIGKLTNELNNQDSEFYFACVGEKVAGYLKLNFRTAQTELSDSNSIEIERIYVLNEFQGKKVGQALFETALEKAQELKSLYIWLGVWEENDKALSFYRKNGFVEFDRHIFRIGDDQQTDLLMKRICESDRPL